MTWLIDGARPLCDDFLMAVVDIPSPSSLAVVDMSFMETFMPYELRLAQRRAMVWGTEAPEGQPNAFIGLYVVRLEPSIGREASGLDGSSRTINEHVNSLLAKVLRDSDIPALISDWEHLAVLRDVDPQRAYVVAQRFLTSARDSALLEQAGLKTRVGYVIYPLSPQPNLPVERWHSLLDLARHMSERGRTSAAACGLGLLRGSQMADNGIPEADLVPLAFENLESLTKAGVLQIQRIQMIPGF